jgi:N-acetylglutamate synthase
VRSGGPVQAPDVGTTVTLRVNTPVGPIGVVGTLLEAAAKVWSVRRRDGSVARIDIEAIAACRVVPPSRAARASVAEVERMAALGWRGLEHEQLGEWLMRAAGGFTGRANSALAVGAPGLGLDAAVDAVERWYAARGLSPRIQLPDRGDPPGLRGVLDRRDWLTSPSVHVMTAELGHVLRAAGTKRPTIAPSLAVTLDLRLDAAPDAAWLAAYRRDAGEQPAVAVEVLVNHPLAVFASLRDGEHAAAVARVAVDDRWAGLFGVEVAPAHRRRGLATALSAAALRWAAERGARRTYLQAATANAPAVRAYERLGYAVHHDYVYRYPAEVRA